MLNKRLDISESLELSQNHKTPLRDVFGRLPDNLRDFAAVFTINQNDALIIFYIDEEIKSYIDRVMSIYITLRMDID